MHRVTRRPGRRTKRWLILLAATSAFAFVIASASGLGGSTFESADGNMIVNTTRDWATVLPTPATILKDRPQQTPALTEDSIVNGGKEDDVCPAYSPNHSVPGKDDLTHAAIYTEKVSGDDFLYEASIRASSNGSSHINLELSQGKTACSASNPLPQRTDGDKLITFDYTAGGLTATIKVLNWNQTLGSGDNCREASAAPCWGNEQSLSASGFADGATNDGAPGHTGAITAAQNPLSGAALQVNRFQELAVNLTDSNILPPTPTNPADCTTFAKVTLKARTSGNSFGSALKDVILGSTPPVSNCGSISIHKHDDAGNDLADAGFTLYKNNAPLAGPRGAEDTATTFTCTSDSSGNCDMLNILFGDYWVVETTTPSGYQTAAEQSVTVSGTTTIELTIVDNRSPGSINIHKHDDAGAHLAGAAFTLYPDNAPVGGSRGAEDAPATSLTCTTDANGDCSIANVPIGDYWVVETTTPSGYTMAADQQAAITGGGQTLTRTFTDNREFKVIVLVCKKSDNSLYSSSVSFDDAALPGAPNSLGTAPAPPTAAQLCGLGGATHDGVPNGSHSASISIP